MRTHRIVVIVMVAVASLSAQGPSSDIEALAEEAYIFTYPMLEAYRTLYAGSVDRSSPSFRSPFNEFQHSRTLADSSSRLVVRPNNDTMTSRAWLDLREGPIIISVPLVEEGRYWSLQLVDIYTHNIAIISPRNQGAGGRIAVVGPSWRGPIPAASTPVRSESQFVLAMVRLGVSGADDVPRVASLQDQISIARVPSSEAIKSMNLPFPAYDRGEAESEGFIRYLNFMLRHVEVHPSEESLLARFAQIGIGASNGVDAAGLRPEVRDAIRGGVVKALRRIREAGTGVPRGTWTVTPSSFGNRARMQGRYLVRAGAAMRGLFGLDQEEAVYFNAGYDATRQPLDGARSTYLMRLGPKDLPPARAFWSLTMYDGEGFMIANASNRHSIGDRTLGLVKGTDGALTVWIGATSPGGERNANWLPAPRGPFTLTLRLYLPDDSIASYTPPPVQQAP